VRAETSAQETIHRGRPWRVHTLCPDFTLLDLWTIPIEAVPARGQDFASFYRVFVANGTTTDSVLANLLFATRFWLGRMFHLDDAARIAIPGCQETSVADRLSTEDRAANHADRITLPTAPVPVSPIYLYEDEALLEISNRTIHALLHLGWVDGSAGHKIVVLAVYIKSRGLWSDAYMTLIKPFRHALVYPPWIARICRAWDEAVTATISCGARS